MHGSPTSGHGSEGSPRAGRPGFTLIEMLVVIAIVALLAALALPAIMRARTSARRVQCGSNLKQLGIALLMYDEHHGAVPWASSPMDFYGAGQPVGGTFSAHTMLLPYLEREPLFNAVNFSSNPYSWANATAIGTHLEAFVCPSDQRFAVMSLSGGNPPAAWTNYAANTGRGNGWFGTASINEGLFVQGTNRLARLADVRDGQSTTAAFSEFVKGSPFQPDRLGDVYQLPQQFQVGLADRDAFEAACRQLNYAQPSLTAKGFNWLNGFPGSTWYNHFLTPNLPSCANGIELTHGIYTASSRHGGGVNIGFVDARVQFVSEKIDLKTWRALATRAGGEVVGQF